MWEDITSNKINQEILRRLNENDFSDQLWINASGTQQSNRSNLYVTEGARDLEWLGYFSGKNTNLKVLRLWSNPFEGFNVFNGAIETFCEGVNSNRSIERIVFIEMDLAGGELFQSLLPFFENNNNLCKLVANGCQFGAGCARQLSLALKGCNISMKSVTLTSIQMEGAQLVEIIEGLGVHPQLESLDLRSMNAGRSECIVALAALLGVTPDLHTLHLVQNDIDDEGVDALVVAVANSNLRFLNLSSINITARGCQSLAALLENPNSNLERLRLRSNSVGDKGAFIFANALATNRKLRDLDLDSNGITADGWSSFSKILCDTSSITNTFLSNHTLESLGYGPGSGLGTGVIPGHIRDSLALNRSSEDKKQVAIKKIFIHHNHFDMQPFFELDLKVLPLVIDLFERARSVETIDEAGIENRKLDAIYQFIRARPDVFEPIPGQGDEKMKRNAVDAFQLLAFLGIIFYFILWAGRASSHNSWLF